MNNKDGLLIYNKILDKFGFELVNIENDSTDIIYEVYLFLLSNGYNVRLKEFDTDKRALLCIRLVHKNISYNIYHLEHNLCFIKTGKKAFKNKQNTKQV